MMKLEVSKRAQNQWLRILVYYNEMGGQRAAAFWDMRMSPEKLKKTI